MGKGKKGRNPGVGIDFKKAKHKVGKKLAKAANETRTDFQARSINLSTQSVARDKTGAAVSERNLTLKVTCASVAASCVVDVLVSE
jgi:pre-rRNA-processing protein IPI1